MTHLEYIRKAVDGINTRLDTINGRVQKAETKLAVIEDRTSEARQEAKDAGRKSAIKWASAIGALLAGGEAIWRSVR